MRGISIRVTIAATAGMLTAFAQIQNQPDDGQWVMPAKNYASTRYSTLDQINTGNAHRLSLSWTFSTGLTRGHEAAPLVRWIQNPKAINEKTAMPVLGVSSRDATDIAAFLYSTK
jgi:glucose dehydrogenase